MELIAGRFEHEPELHFPPAASHQRTVPAVGFDEPRTARPCFQPWSSGRVSPSWRTRS